MNKFGRNFNAFLKQVQDDVRLQDVHKQIRKKQMKIEDMITNCTCSYCMKSIQKVDCNTWWCSNCGSMFTFVQGKLQVKYPSKDTAVKTNTDSSEVRVVLKTLYNGFETVTFEDVPYQKYYEIYPEQEGVSIRMNSNQVVVAFFPHDRIYSITKS